MPQSKTSESSQMQEYSLCIYQFSALWGKPLKEEHHYVKQNDKGSQMAEYSNNS